MNTRTWMLFGALLSSPTWALEPGFDLSNPAIKKIVHDVAVSHSVAVQMTEAKPAERQPLAHIDFSLPAKPPRVTNPAPRPSTTPAKEGLLSHIVGSLLGLDDADDSLEANSIGWLKCLSRQDLKMTAPSTCSGVNAGPL